MILTDTGPIVALLDKDDAYHSICFNAARLLPHEPMLTTWPCFTEAMYLLGSVGGFHYQVELWKLYKNRRLIVHDTTASEIDRMAEFMEKYHDIPMDLADASIMALAESRHIRSLFTLDNDFRIYRLSDGTVIEFFPL